MASKRPRIMFTPSDRAFAAIQRVAKVTEKPVSFIVAEQVDVMVEHLENLAFTLEHAERLQKEGPQEVKAAARHALQRVLGILDKVQEDLEPVWNDLTDQLGMFQDREPMPPPSNTGATKPRSSPASTPPKGAAHA
jgi:predicted DNA-binding protein